MCYTAMTASKNNNSAYDSKIIKYTTLFVAICDTQGCADGGGGVSPPNAHEMAKKLVIKQIL